jgi:glycerol-3-phosphate dehydrogenase
MEAVAAATEAHFEATTQMHEQYTQLAGEERQLLAQLTELDPTEDQPSASAAELKARYESKAAEVAECRENGRAAAQDPTYLFELQVRVRRCMLHS